MFCYCSFFAVLAGFLVGGTAGIVTAAILMVLVILFMIFKGVLDKDIRSTLLVDLAVIATNFMMLYDVNYWIFTVPVSLGAFFHIISRIAVKGYNTESLSAFLGKELRVPAGLEVALMVFLFILILKDDLLTDPYAWILMALLFADFLRQVGGINFFAKVKNKIRR